MKNTSHSKKRTFKTVSTTVLLFSALSIGSITTSHAQDRESSTSLKASTSQNTTTEAQQEFVVKGIVKDINGAIPDVNIVLKNSTTGTITDFDGAFTFPQPLQLGDTLVVSFIGFDTQEITISGDHPLDIQLEEASENMIGAVATNTVYTSKRSHCKK